MYAVKFTSQFKKDLKAIEKRGRNIALLKAVVSLLASRTPLPPTHRDHPLRGDWTGHRECHIAPDWLLVYRRDDDIQVIALDRTGTHADIFGN